MLIKRPSDARGKAEFGWLYSRHTFSFGQYRDPDFMGYGPLRVINEDRVQPGHGFGEHGHQDMEIISYVIDGALEHKDSLGNGSVIKPGHVQRMTAGTGVRHSEFNPSSTDSVHFLQIWIVPNQDGLEPGYEEAILDTSTKHNQLRLIGSGTGADGAVWIHQDVDIFASVLDAGEQIEHLFRDDRLGWLQIIRGEVHAKGETLSAGDGLAIQDESILRIAPNEDAEFLLFDMGR
ncbi:MAG: pirin family protein [Woeseiaceae bacterium]